jgi:nicotinate-nucleotide adenylyltransferase
MSFLRKIGIFGGSFDPVHLGHLHLATVAKEALTLDEVRFVPCRISPHKTDTPPASGADRLALLQLATAGIPWAVVDDLELLESDLSYSFQTAETMARRFPQAHLFWLMGSDQWAALPRWKNPQRLAACVDFIVLTRGETPESRPGYRLHVIQHEHPATSTAIRAAISSGQDSEWLAPDVSREISSRGLYQD